MEKSTVFAIGATLFAFFGVLIAARLLAQGVMRQRLRSRQGMHQGKKDTQLARLLRNGFGPFLGLSDIVIKLPVVAGALSKAQDYCEDHQLSTGVRELGSCVIALVLSVAIAGGLVSQSFLGSVACAGLALCLLLNRVQAWEERRMDAQRESVPEVLQTMMDCSQAGLTLLQTMQTIASQEGQKLHHLFEKSAHVLQAGGSSAQALTCLREESHLPELTFVSVALDVQHQSGGSMRSVFASAKDMVENEMELRRSLQVQTAQARLSARVVTIMPFLMLALLSLFSQDFLSPFFSSAAGVATLALALTMQFCGVMAVRRLLRIDD